jgi:Plasmid pRiA4b ORF-3-like protein
LRSAANDLPGVHRLTVTIDDVRPAVWRRLDVPSTATLAELHELVQVSFGWDGGRRHEFEVDGVRYGTLAETHWPPGTGLRDEAGAVLGRVAARPGAELVYRHDTGRVWSHRIEVEAVEPAEPGRRYPACLDGGGLTPPPDGGPARPGAFDPAAIDALNRRLAGPGPAGAERGPAAGPGDPGGDPLFASIFPTLALEEGDEVAPLRPYVPVAPEELAAAAAASALVRRARHLAHWVGPRRPLTDKGLLRPADAVEIWRELEPDDEVPTIASVRQLPRLQALWSAAVEAGLIEIRSTEAGSGAGAAVWAGSDPLAQLDSWSRLLAGYLRSRAESTTETPAFSRDDVIVAAAQMYYSMARDPIPALLPALAVVMAEELRTASMFVAFGLPAVIEAAADDWITAGVLTVVDGSGTYRPDEVAAAREMVDGLIGAVDDPSADPSAFLLRPVIELVRASPLVEVTPLGSYGLRRILAAQGFTTPRIGDLVDVAPTDLLDRLVPYDAPDAFLEAAGWVEAHDDRESLLALAFSARVEDRRTGPVRRSVLQLVLAAAGERAAPVLDDLAGDPWLGAAASSVAHILGLGPPPSLADELWLAIDSLSSVLDEDEDEQAEIIEGSRILELLGRPDGLATAVALAHPYTRAGLQLVSGWIDDPTLAGQLQFAIGRRPPNRNGDPHGPQKKARRRP